MLEDIIVQLETKYRNLTHGDAVWASESDAVRRRLELLGQTLERDFEFVEARGVGGVGIVLKVRDTNMDASRALKFPRPSAGREDAFAAIIAAEISRLREAEHPNVIGIHHQGTLADPVECPYYVMDYLPDAEDARDYFRRSGSEQDLLGVIVQLANGLAHLHRCGIVHLDVKLENVLVASTGRAVLSDLGSARRLDEPDDDIEVVTTREWAHPDLLRNRGTESASDPNRIRIPIRRSSLRTAFDLYALGRNIQRLLEPKISKGLSPYEHKYLDLMACRLLDGRNGEDDRALGLPASAFRELLYTSMDEVVEDLAKLTGTYQLHSLIPELDEHGGQTIQTSSLSATPLTETLKLTLESPLVQRLASVRQLGFLSLVYPTASHSRLEHVLGTFSNAVRYCDALYHDPENPFFRQIMTVEDLKTVCAAAICHDIGQYPLAHDLEEANRSLFSHVDICKEILTGTFSSNDGCNQLLSILKNTWHVDPKRVSNVIATSMQPDKGSSIKDRILHSILSSPIDADKVDYLVRDSSNLGVPYGNVIDFNRLLRCLTIVFRDDAGSTYASLGIHEKGKVVAEAVAFARYAMFGSVYWHHTSRAGKAMLHRATWELMEEQNWTHRSKTLRKMLREYVLAEQTNLPVTREERNSPLAESDRGVLRWIAGLSTPIGKALVSMLVERRLYKRLLVVSASKNQELWQLVRRVQSQGWSHELKLQRELVTATKEKLQVVIRKANEEGRDAEKELALLEALAKNGVLLVDTPRERRGAAVDLEYLPESDNRETRGLWQHPVNLEDSVVWKQLTGSFLESVGKIRVFCHPDHRKLVDSVFDRPALESLLATACRRAEADEEADEDEGEEADESGTAVESTDQGVI
jgi:HD superfamily phosphohydrolase